MSFNDSYIDEFEVLATYLKENQDEILEKWERLFYDEAQATKLLTLSRKQFHDHVPKFLDVLGKRLRKEEESLDDVAKEHGIHRWEHGVDLREMSKEWSNLHKILMEYVNSAADVLSFGPDVQIEAHRVISNVIHEGIKNSIDQFYHLQDREAQAQMRDLESALSEKKFKDENLQQTSHDLKGVLFSLQVGISLLEEKDLNEDAKEVLSEMSIAADNLEQYMRNLLDLFRLEAGKDETNITKFDIEAAITEVCESLRPLAASESLDLRCHGEVSFQVQGDRSKVQRICQNLLINALKYTKEGHVEVTWRQESEQDWELVISDTGPGLSATKAASLTSDSGDEEITDSNVDSHGEGIGLLIVRRLCNLLNGIIDIDTTLGEGTTFRIIFPLKYAPDE